MDNNNILQETANNLKDIESRITSANELIRVMKAAGEDVTVQENLLKQAEIRQKRWKAALADRNIKG